MKSSGLQKKPKLLIARRVSGNSMLPVLSPGHIVLASSLFRPKLGRLVIVRHDGREKIKRLSKIDGTRMYILGDNPGESTDSRQFGWIDNDSIIATVIWTSKF